jgi:hypothetical protein
MSFMLIPHVLKTDNTAINDDSQNFSIWIKISSFPFYNLFFTFFFSNIFIFKVKISLLFQSYNSVNFLFINFFFFAPTVI